MFVFSPIKTAQAAAFLLKQEEAHRMGRLRLLKLLYMADRERIKLCGRPITGDRVVAMDHGPVLSRTYDLIKGSDFDASLWERFFTNSGRDVVLKEDPGNGELSRRELEVLGSIASRFSSVDDYGVAVVSHEFEEWCRNKPEKGTSKPIPVEHVLEATGRLSDQLGIADAIQAETHMARLLGTVKA
jgi:uncharacterized phage-associated protein